MTMLETIAVAFSMFSAIPMPQFLWNEKNMRYALCAFPLIGAVIGAVCWGDFDADPGAHHRRHSSGRLQRHL